MNNIRFKLDMDGLRELMKSSEMNEILAEAGDEVARSAMGMTGGEPFATRVHEASYVSIANVYPDSDEAAKLNSKDNIVLKALSSSGLPMTK